MQIIRALDTLRLSASACALGMFDGVHLGHVIVLENALREARILNIPSVVLSFSSHPQFLISQTPTQQLSNLEERLHTFERMGFDYALILDFTQWLQSLPPEAFVQKILQDCLNVRSVTIGYDHRFGKNRLGDGAMLQQIGQIQGFEVRIIDPVRIKSNPIEGEGQIISSTLIRKLLGYGEIQEANRLLGYQYTLAGPVEEGLQRGRVLGFPTANIAVEPYRLIPTNGVYAGYAQLRNKTHPAVCNIGYSPTFGDQLQKRIEVHLLDGSHTPFYGEVLKMTFHQKIRDERTFSHVDALIEQIRQDCQTAWQILNQDSTTASITKIRETAFKKP